MIWNSEHILSRRVFLASCGAGMGRIVFRPPALRAAAKRVPRLSFIVVSDTHLGYRDRDRAARLWRQTVREIKNLEAPLVLHLGDVVDGGREAQYPVYREARNSLGKPVYEIPGNHDPADLFEKYLAKADRRSVNLKWLRFLLLNNSRRDSHDGFLNSEQIAWCDEQCRQAAQREQFVVVCMHVPVHWNRHPDRGWHVKPEHGQREFYAAIRRHSDVVLGLFHGHFHNGIRGWNDHGDLQEIAFPSALYNRDRKLTKQKAPGYNVDEFRPGYTRVTIQGATMTLRYKPLGESQTSDKVCPLPALS